MTPTIVPPLILIAAVIAAAPGAVRAQSGAPTFTILDVPYLPQTLELCGGAAAAMVMRYWGETGVRAESFEHLVDREAGGIRGADLVRALQARGWQALSFAGDPPVVRRQLAEGRPAIVLVEDRPDRLHYVVVLAWHDGRVMLHDPARAPFRLMREDAFVRAWRQAGHWTLLAVPGAAPPMHAIAPVPTPESRSEPPTTNHPPAGGICAGMVAEGVRLAHAGELDAAHDLLQLASIRCPSEAATWRELAGLHALRREWGLAARAASHAVRWDGSDQHALNLLATSRFLEGDAHEALDYWNRIGEPHIDLVQVHGLERIRYDVAAAALGRVDALAWALRAGVDRELRVEVASPTGGGEVWYAAWRWWESRPRLAAGLAAPSPFGGTWRVDGFDERQTYAAGAVLLEERHRRLGVSIGDWATSTLGWEAGVAVETWPERQALSLSGTIEHRLASDRMAITTKAAQALGVARVWRASTSVSWRSRVAQAGTVWQIDANVSAAGEEAPMAMWAGAGAGHGRAPLLRAHPLVRAGIVQDGVFGRQLAHTTLEWRRWSPPVRGLLRIAPAAFVDMARAGDVGAVGDARGHVDVGAGLRLSLPGTGVLRVDVARGLRDGQAAVSVGLGR